MAESIMKLTGCKIPKTWMKKDANSDVWMIGCNFRYTENKVTADTILSYVNSGKARRNSKNEMHTNTATFDFNDIHSEIFENKKMFLFLPN